MHLQHPCYASNERHYAKEGVWSGFAISKNEMPFVAQTVIMGGNPRVGLEDNLYLSKGKLATNAQLVEKAIRIVEDLGATTMTPRNKREVKAC